MSILLYISIAIMLISAVYAIFTKDILISIVALGINSLVASILFFIMQQPDVAITEASIGAGLSTAIFMLAVKHTKRYEEKR
jgi:energy-converting hydrogenase B subunit D